MTLVEDARRFAALSHDGQRRKGAASEPYFIHLSEVAETVAGFGGTPEAIAAAWLHDTVEDCGVSLETLAARFGAQVAALVAEVSDDKALDKVLRKQLQIENAAKKSPEAALIKICDKLSNVRSVGYSPAAHWGRARQLAYLDWAEAVVARLPAGADPVRGAFALALAASRAAVLARPA